jgi:hypothetical protein
VDNSANAIAETWWRGNMEDARQTNPQDGEILSEEGAGEGRQRSSIAFPYADLEDAEQIALAIHGNVGSGVCEDDQLAAWLGLSPRSSGYRVRIAATRLFGVIESPSAGTYQLTDLGKQIIDPERRRSARVSAFLNVPLFQKMYEQHKGGVIPPAAAFERTIEGAGVAPKQKTRARQILERSADYAGFFQQGKTRLVKPGIADAPPSDPAPPRDGGGGNDHGAARGSGGGATGGSDDLDPMIVGLFSKLPRGDGPWNVADRVTWLKAATVIFQLVYGTEKEVDVYVKGTKLHFGGQAGKPQSFAGGGSAEGLAEHPQPGSDEA